MYINKMPACGLDWAASSKRGAFLALAVLIWKGRKFVTLGASSNGRKEESLAREKSKEGRTRSLEIKTSQTIR